VHVHFGESQLAQRFTVFVIAGHSP